ncbi:nonribosomal peptide synthase [Aspergillus ustus]|uniref:Nonribosomal peptide synthase n=1 Tax=Aspergillus ustus TaxID=40382 RepID=A0A0C1EGB9_ASPUT|nr:nonribosomal peptide synthase [Aspergillus ustus]
MAQYTRCCLPSFGATPDSPKRPVSVKAKTTPAQRAKLLSAFEQGSLDPLLQTAWGLLLHRYTGLEDICFGYQRFGVDEPLGSHWSETTQLSTCRLSIDEKESIEAILKKFEDEDDSENGVNLKEGRETENNGYSLFNTIVMLRVCQSRIKGGTSVRPVLPPTLSEQCRARLHVKVLQGDICIFIEWWNTEISATHMESIACYFEQLLDQVIFNQRIAVADTTKFLEHDWTRICKFNSTLPQTHDRCIHEVIQEQARLHPKREAVCAWDGNLTFEELDYLASKLAYHLQCQGVGPETRVPLCFDKSKWNIVAMIGVLKAGGAFVPLDPTHPTSRLRSLVDSVDGNIMLCSRDRADSLSMVVECLIPLDEHLLNDLSPPPDGGMPLGEAQSNNAAYLIFTSGSTGQPKGTVLEHKAFVSCAAVYAPRMNLNSDCRCLQFAAHTFDASLAESLSPLMHGGCVCVPSDGDRLNDVIRAINELRANHVTFTPSFVKFINPDDVPGVETLILAGEAMSMADVETWSHINLINAYGPTENAVCATLNTNIRITSECGDIGLPASVRVWVVNPDNHNRLVPVGSPGELLLEGPSLARCYWNNPQKTDEVFIWNPEWAIHDSGCGDRRFYKTGDLVRYNSDAGSLTFIGRKDTQIKLHGQRIELGEIENNINTLPKVKHCLAFLSKSGSTKGKIVAVVSLHSSSSPDAALLKPLPQSEKTRIAADLRGHLHQKLPTYMIPAVWLGVEAMPLLPSGKLNRREIVDWASRQTGDVEEQISACDNKGLTHPEDSIEDRLASIWSRVLNIPRQQMDLEEGFLSLGGDSIAAITCMGHCKKQGMSATVQDILQCKSIRDLATRVGEVIQPVVYKEATEVPFDLSPIQTLHFMTRSEGQDYFNQGVRTRMNQAVREHDLRQAIETIIKRHSMLRARLVQNPPPDLPRLRITEEVESSYRLRIHDVGQDVDMDGAISDSQTCIDAIEGPLLSVDFFQANTEGCVLSMVAHHLVVDIVSWRIILEDLEEILMNTEVKVPNTDSLPFSSWCHLQAERTRTLNQSKIDSPTIDSAYWGMENQVTTYGDAICETFELDPNDSHLILLGCHKALETEPIDVLLAALLYAFGQTFRDRPLPVIHNEGHGREVWDSTIDISRTVGWFTTLFPISIACQGAGDPVDTVVHVKDLRRSVSDNGRQSFANRISAAGSIGKQEGPVPMEISFNYVGQHRDLQRQDGLFQLMNQMAGETGRGGGSSDYGKDTPRFALFEISAVAVNGRLRFIFSFSRHMRHQEAIRTWVASCSDALRLLGRTLQSLPPKPTLSSYPMLSLTYQDLEDMVDTKLPTIGVDSPDLIEDIYPCSRVQQGILLAHSRDTSLYAVHDTYEVRRLEDKPDVMRLANAWRMVVSRHAMLRTLFVDNLTTQDLFSQVVLKSFEPTLVHLTCLDDDDVLSTFNSQAPAAHDKHKPHHRLTTCETAKGTLFFRLELGHAAMDGVSISTILGDLQAAYDGQLDHHKPLFKYYVHHLRNMSQEASFEYWRTYLADMEPCLFPILNDGQEAPQKEFRTMQLSFGLFNELQTVCEKRRLTISTAFTAAWGLTLRQFCSSNDVCFSYMASLRDLPVEDIESVVGPVINLVACRMRVSESDSLNDILQTVQSDCLQHLHHNSLYLVDIQNELKISDTALLNSGISYQKPAKLDTKRPTGIHFSRVGTAHDPAEYPLFINVVASDKDAGIELNYWTDMLSDGQARNVCSIFLKCLHDIVHHHESQISQLELLSEQNKQLLRKWNQRTLEEPDICVDDLVRGKALAHPVSQAISAWDGDLTYRDLDQLSSSLATYLAQFGVCTGTLVSVHMHGSRWQTVAILAILRAGGVCVPGNIDESESSLDGRSAGNGVQIALTSPSETAFLEETYPVVVAVDESLFETLPNRSTALYQQMNPSDSGYIVFTTDSTQNTSAVILSQRAILARATAFVSTLSLDSTTKTFQNAPISSDIFLQELFGTISSGGCLCVPEQNSSLGLPEAVNRTGANFICTTPSIASTLRPVEVPEVQVLALFGELPTKAIKETWSTKVQLHSFFGTAECSSTCIHESEFNKEGIFPTIGSSTGCYSWLVDPSDYSRLVPVGCVGELLIEGPGISHGYLYEESRTKDKYIELENGNMSPAERTYTLSSKPSRQIFRTGQLARYNSDGTLVYLGKKDPAVAQKTQMTALQIEQLLGDLMLPNNRCIVEVLNPQSEPVSEIRIAVFVVPSSALSTPIEPKTKAIAPKTSEFHQLMTKVHTYLSNLLPPSQVPSLYFPVQVLPLTVSGTLDRHLLKDTAQRLPAASLLEYDIKIFGEFWRQELGGLRSSGLNLLQPLSGQGQPALRVLESDVRVSWGGYLHRDKPKASLFAAWALAVHSFTQCEDLIIGDLAVQTASIIPRRVRLTSIGRVSQLSDQMSSSLDAAEIFERASLSSIRCINSDTARACSFATMLSVSDMGVNRQSAILERFETEESTNSELGVCPLVVFCILEQDETLVTVRYDERALFPSQIERLMTLFGESLELLRSAGESQEQISDLVKRGYESVVAFNSSLSFWKDQLAEVEPCLFPILSPNEEGSRFSVESLRLSNASKIHNACKSLSITPMPLLQVVWGLVLRCYTGLEDVCFGYYVSPKKTPTDIVPCRLSLHDNMKLSETILSRRENMERTLKNRMPLFEIRRAIAMEDSPIFNTAFRYRKSSAGAAEFSNAILNAKDEGADQYLIIVTASVSGPSGEVNFEYQPSCLSRSDMGSIVDCFEHTLSSVLATLGSDRHIQNVDFFGPRSCRKVSKWNANLPPEPKRCAPEVIQSQVLARPSGPAICSWDGNFTYAQLDSLSTKLAYHLMDMGVGPEVFVGLCFEKSAWAVIAQVAVLKAGGVFASLDPAHPKGRLKGLVDDIDARVVLCSSGYLDKVSQICNAAWAVNQDTLELLPDTSATKHFPSLSIRNAAYAIFTSGTTGKPKVTVLEHAALGVAVSSFTEAYEMGPDTRAIQFSSYTFDVSIFETIIVLMTGGCVCIPSDEERMNDLGGAIRRMEANVIACTPSVTDTLDPASVPSLRTIINGGEKRTEAQIARWADRNYFNAYGPSEATVIATSSRKVDRNGARLDDDSNSIGTAVCGRAWIVDPYNHNRLLPVGAVGELVLEGHNIARGYLNNEKKTNEVFINQPRWCCTAGLRAAFSRNERMYRTGDLVRYKSDGNICFISRIGTQVKLNGQRVELEEIEQQCVSLLPAGTQALVDIVVPETKTISKSLAVFFTVQESDARSTALRDNSSSSVLLSVSDTIRVSIGSLHTALGQVLPQIMIPKLYFPIRYLPLGNTGKLDRRGLRGMIESLTKDNLKQYMILAASPGRATEQAAESTLRGLWGEVLQLEPGSIGDDDSFFALGGDSFSAMKLVGVARAQDISLTVSDIYAHPVLSDLTHCCANVRVNIEQPTLEPFTLVPDSTPLQAILEEASSQCDVIEEAISDAYPCSAVQEGLITLSIQHRGAYVARSAFQLAPTIDLERFKAAWQQTVAELDILRTRIVHTEAAGFLQIVLQKERISWTMETSFDDLMQDTLESNGGRLAKYAMVHLENSERYFVWIVHHALYDGWNALQILRRVEEIYSNSSTQTLTVPYKFFIHHLHQRDLSQSDEFWKSYLDGLSCAPFPPRTHKELDNTSKRNVQRANVSISRAPGASGLTISELIRAAWAIVLSVHTANEDVCFGEILMGRNISMPGITDVAGPVLTTVPVRLAVNNKLPLTQYLHDVRQTAASMIHHQHSGLQRIQKLSSDAALACNFQNLLVIQSNDVQLNKDIWSTQDFEVRGDFLTYPLVVECTLSNSDLLVHAYHDELALDNWHTERLIGQFTFVLEQLLHVSQENSITVGDIDVASPSDKREIALWNQRQVTCVDRCAHDIIREQALRQPQAPAICSWDGGLTYQEMIDVALPFARYLVSCGIGPEILVPVCLDKSLWAMVTILSVLLAGGAFVPLDPSHPTSRHKEILAEVDADIILCSPQHRSRYLGSVSTIIPVSKETIRAYGAIKIGTTLPSKVAPTSMAYAIFTSGSTGRPKGIVIEHRSVCSSVLGFAPVMDLSADSRIFQFASLTFDAAILEVLGTLMIGGCICVPSEDERLNDISGAMQRLKVSWSFLTPSVASIIEPSSVPSLKVLSLGGEKLSREVVAKWVNHVKLLGAYGPTETVIFAAVNSDFVNHDPACIGHGIPSTLTWIIDPEDHNRLTPLGAVGELALEGPPLARGYLKNPKKTAEIFVDEPAWLRNFPGSLPLPRRIYKTGDLVRYNPDGTVQYLGRKDHQVKLHGQRMELGEIEHRLLDCQHVRHVLVILPHAGPLKQKLVGVLSLKSLASEPGLNSGGALELVSPRDMARLGKQEISAIQKSIEVQLPIYMVPQAWAAVKDIPMLVSGKLDRKRVTQWIEQLKGSSYDQIMQDYDDVTQDNVEQEDQEGGNPAIDIIRVIFAQVLNLPLHKVDPSRSFINLGGDSITGMAVVSKARKNGLSLPLNRVLQSKSIEALSLCCEAKAPETQTAKTKESMAPFRLSPIQELFFRYIDTAPKSSDRFNQSVTVRLTRSIQSSMLRNAVQALVQKHSMFRARFSKSADGTWRQRITDDTKSSFIFRTHAIKSQGEMSSSISESQRSIDIQTGPVLVADLFEEDGQQVLFLVASHLCVDVVSWRTALQELEDFVNAGPLSPSAPFLFQSWCNLQLRSSKDASNNLELPCQLPDLDYWGMRGLPNNYGHVKMETFTLDKQTTAFISEGCHHVLRTETIEVLLAAVLRSFNLTFTDRDTPTIYNEGHGREVWGSSDPSETVGWFTTFSPLHVRGTLDFFETLKRVKDTRRRTLGHSRANFARNVLHAEYDKEANKFSLPLEILFNYLGKLQQLERADSLFKHHGDIFNAETLVSTGDMGPETPRFSLFEVSALILEGQLHVSFTCNRNMQHQSRIQAWIAECKRVLEADLLKLRTQSPEPTLSDYPLLPTTYDGLKDLADTVLPRLNIESWDQIEDIYPCSPVQEGILLSQLRDPHGYTFNAVFEVRSPGNSHGIDITKLRKAWSMVVARHSVLRTAFIDSSCKGCSFDQLVLKRVNETAIEIECDDSYALDKLDGICLQSTSSNVCHQLVFCKTSTGRVLLKVEMNHAIIDGGSMSILLKDLALAYGDRLPSGAGPLFSEYIKFTRGESQGEALAHWKRHLSGIRPCHLPVTPSKNDKRELNSCMMTFKRFAELQRFCETNSITLANLTLSAWAIVLRSHIGSDDICFGYPSTGRDLPVSGIQEAVGIFINTLCCRVRFRPGQTFLDLSRFVQDDHIQSLPHQRASLAEIQHALGENGKALFNTCISIQNHSDDKPEDADLSFEFLEAYDPSEYPITVNVETARGREGILLRYWADAISDAEATGLADAIAKVFTCFVETPSRLISDLKLQEKETLAVSEMLMDRRSIEQMIDERIQAILSRMLKDGKLGTPWVKEHDADLPKDFFDVENGIEESLKGIVVARQRTPSGSTMTLSSDYRAPNDIEKQLWRLWGITLGLPPHPVKYHDSFFKLGGDSITAMKLVGSAREEGVKLSVSDVFKNPVFEDMVTFISKGTKPAVPTATPMHEKHGPIEEFAKDTPLLLPHSESSQEISILTPIQLDDTSLRAAICPKIGVFKGGIVDILPVTDFQSLSITATMFESRWMLNYFFLDGKGSLDIKRLRESFLRVVDAFDVLRTVFVCYHGQFFQVVLRKIRPDIFVHETDKSLDEYTKSLQQRDRNQPPGQGEQNVQFYVVRKANSDEHRILVRISHAQFDGVCLPKIMTAIKMAYEGCPITPSSYLNYMRVLPGTITPEHYHHWASLLKGSKMTEVIQRDRPNTFRNIGGFAEQKKTIEIPSTATENITIATVMQSAWAITLAKLSAQDDVVFGLTVNGRNAVPGLENTVGPCLNFVPIRVRFKDRWTALDLFRFLQDQQVSNMPYESLGFREIIRRCTDWPDSSFFTTTVLHQNVDYEGQMQLDNNAYKMGGVGVIDNFTDLTLFSKPVAGQPDHITVSLGYSLKGPLHPTFVSTVLDMVCDTAQSLVANPNVLLPSPSTLRSLPLQVVEDTSTTSSSDKLLSSLNSRSLSEILANSELLTRIWQQVLPPRSTTSKSQPSYQLDSSFFRQGGDIVNMAQIVWILEQETNLHVRLEDLLAHPTFLGQMAVLALYTTKRDARVNDSSEAAPSYASDADSTVASVGGRNTMPPVSAKSENWSALDRARVLAKKLTRFGGLSTRV